MSLRPPPASILVLSLVVPTLAAQSHMKRVKRPRETVQVDLATGAITRGSPAQPRAATTVNDFPNMDLSGFVAVDSGGNAVEWFNDGVKGLNGNVSDMMDSFTFAYCSAMKDTSLGGPGASLKFGLYEGYTRGGDISGVPNGTAVAVMTLTGLPANSASSSMLGNVSCYFVTVHFGSLVPFADGPIGYSWKYRDLGTDGVLAGTGPFLSSAGSCAGTTPSTDALGQAAYDCCSFAPADVYLNGLLHVVLTFAPYCIPYAIGVDILEAADLTATASPFTGDGINADILNASPVVLGQTWTSQVTLGHGHGALGLVNLRVRTGTLNGPNFNSPFGGRLTELLIGGPLLASISSSHDGVSSPPITAAVPLQFGILCQNWAVQATVAGGGFVDFSTAVSGVTGTQ